MTTELPPFAGICTFFRLPVVAEPTGVDIGLLGVPFDGGQFSTVSGARFGPRAAREASLRVKPYNVTLNINPYENVVVADCGDVPANPLDLDQARQQITQAVRGLVDAGATPLCVGGDHSISFAILDAVAAAHKGVGLVHFDAHTDTSPLDLGMRHGHGTPFRRALEHGLIDPHRSIQIGLRGSTDTADKYEYARAQGMELIMLDEVLERGLPWTASRFERLRGLPVYVSIDLDVLDPAYAPATGPNPGGLTSRELLYLVRRLEGHAIVGGDIVEFDAPYDSPTKATAILVAHLLFELVCLCALYRGKRGGSGRE